jgi:ubiquinone/menaquinone biosynthesis C-methylase UbiE
MKRNMSQQAHRSDPRILNRRTLQRDHRYLAAVLRGGMDVLDLGCGTGAITAGIARAVAPSGTAVGVDRDEANVTGATEEYGGIENLRFERVDILALDDRFNDRFDIVTAARTLQWISEPQGAIRNMKQAVKPGGRVIVLDYNLDETHWEPDPPAGFRRFYQAFLEWRNANHWDNRMAAHLAELFRAEGLAEVSEHATDEVVRRGDSDFPDAYASGIWLYVIQTLGPTLVQAGFVAEAERVAAEREYGEYVRDALEVQRHFMLTVDGRWLA